MTWQRVKTREERMRENGEVMRERKDGTLYVAQRVERGPERRTRDRRAPDHPGPPHESEPRESGEGQS